jgi:hypothetical protein
MLRSIGTAVLLVLGSCSLALAQVGMPDARQMSGIPRPVDDLPDGSISVLLVRGELSNVIVTHAVELQVAGKTTETATTDESGHVRFGGIAPGTTVKAIATVDGERLESEEFPVPARGGIRLLLAASRGAAAGAEAADAAVTGEVTIAGQSRMVIEPGEESVALYYLLDVSNTTGAPVNPKTPFTFDMPAGAVGTTVLDSSSRLVRAQGSQVRVEGPFPPGITPIEVACELPYRRGSLQVIQRFPARLDQFALFVRSSSGLSVRSPQIARQEEITPQGQRYVASTGGAVAAGQPIVIDLGGLPHHSEAARWTALSIAAGILVLGAWSAFGRGDSTSHVPERKRLVQKREQLFGELVALEIGNADGRRDPARYIRRRAELVAALEQVYGSLDIGDDTGREPAPSAGIGVS